MTVLFDSLVIEQGGEFKTNVPRHSLWILIPRTNNRDSTVLTSDDFDEHCISQ